MSHYWSQANCQTVTPLDILQYGWALENDVLFIMGDSQDNMQKIRENVKFLTMNRLFL